MFTDDRRARSLNRGFAQENRRDPSAPLSPVSIAETAKFAISGRKRPLPGWTPAADATIFDHAQFDPRDVSQPAAGA
jgi:hypothetical protein